MWQPGCEGRQGRSAVLSASVVTACAGEDVVQQADNEPASYEGSRARRGCFRRSRHDSPRRGRSFGPSERPCGARLSPYQLAELLAVARSRTLVIAFDNDPAGRAASGRTFGLARTADSGLRLSRLLLAEKLHPAVAASLPPARIVPHSPRSPRCSRVYRDGSVGVDALTFGVASWRSATGTRAQRSRSGNASASMAA